MKPIKLVIFCVLLVTLTGTTLGQTTSFLVDDSKPSVFVSYERRGRIAPLSRGDGSERIWLKLHNNTRIPVFLCKVDVPKEYGDALLPRRVFQSGTLRNIPLTNLGFDTTDVCSVLEIRSGNATTFSVPSEELAVGRLIEVEFYFGWTSDWHHDLDDGVKSFVRFGADQIAKP